ncbi:LamG-like jellyroll fold domain-containing protein [Actinacidiphila glaucinigra]
MSGLLASLPVLSSSGAAAHAAATDAAGDSAAVALHEAAASGERVEVEGERSEYSTTYANPDGYTLTLEQSVVPVRVAQPDGSWAAPDPTLQRRADGSIAPKAAVADMALSGGGADKPLVTLAEGKRSLSLGWPGALPTPVLDGPSATYPEVLPGVDLRMTATVDGVRQVLIVKNAQAAENPELEKIEFSLATDGLTVQNRAGGGLDAIDEDGNSVFRSPAAQMWDSAGDTETPALRSASAAEDLPVQDGDGESSSDPASGPSDGDTAAMVPVTVSEDSVAVHPDADLLGGEDTVYPLYIDPDIGLSEDERTVLSSDGDVFYNFSGGDDGLGVGLCGTYVTGGYSYYCGSGYKNRMYFEFSPSKLAGKRVLDATFRVSERWSMSCTKSVVDLVRTGNISSATRWPGPTSNWDVMGDRTVSAGRGTACDPDQPDAPIEFNDDPAQSYENLTATVKSFAAGDISRLTLMLKAHDETDPNGWKRFDDDATLSVNYVGLPGVPTSAGILHGNSVTCAPADDPDIVAEPKPMFSARAQTAAGGESGAHLRVRFHVDKKVGSAWEEATDPVRPSTGSVGDNGLVQYASPITLSNGATYRMAILTRSLYNDDSSFVESHSTITTTGYCYFKIDTSAPQGAVVTFGAPYSECAGESCAAAGGPGTKAEFTFAPLPEDVGTVTDYQYHLTTEKSWSTPIHGETVKATIVPRLSGLQQLHVRAKDANGWGAEKVVEFKVAEGQGAVGRWHFDDLLTQPGTTVAADTATEGIRHPATLYTTGAGWSALARRGNSDRSVWLNDTSDVTRHAGYAATSESVVNTKSSFTVSAWAYLADNTAYRTIVSQTGSDHSGFSLYYSPGTKKYTLRWSWQDAAKTRQFITQASTTDVPLKVWSHVAGVYDAEAHTIQLFVNGIAQGDPKAVPTGGEVQTADGPLQFGRASYVYGTFTDYWQGRVDEAAVWQRKLQADEIALESRLLEPDGTADVELVANWNSDGASGTTLADTLTGYGRSLAVTGGATLDGQGIALDGVDDAATAKGPIIDETGSFTVTAGVELDTKVVAAKPDGYVAQVAGQRGVDGGASWGLWFEKTGTDIDPETEQPLPVGYWRFGRMNADRTWTAVSSDEATVVSANSVTQVSGVYDSSTRTINLHIGGNPNGEDLAYTAIAGSDEFAVGKAFINSAWGNYLAGRVTDIRIWVGAMTDQQINAIAGGAGA